MKNVLFAHDGYVSVTENGIYSDTYNDKIVKRYSNIAENIVFMVRTCEYQDKEMVLNRISTKNFSVVGIKNFKSIRGILNYPKLLGKIKQEVLKADYIVARIPSDLGFLAAKYAKKYNKRYMVEVVGCPWDSLRNHSFIGKIVAPSYYVKQKKAIQNAPYAIYVTNEFLQKRYPCSGIHIGCSDVEIKNEDEVITRRMERISNSEPHNLCIGTIGALHMKYKGYDTVIKAICDLNSNGYSYKYLIAGNGNTTWLKSVIHKYHAEDFVLIVPPMSHERVFEWLDKLDIYIQPSKTEGMPRALIEAMSRGLPSFGTSVGGITELLEAKYLLSNSKRNVKELCSILTSCGKEELKSQAYRNYIKAQEYNKDVLESLRCEFYNEFCGRGEN